MRLTATYAAVLYASFCAAEVEAVRPSTCAQLAEISAGVPTDQTRFETTAQITHFSEHVDDGFYAADSTGAAHFGDKRIDRSDPLLLGATYRLKGIINTNIQLWCDSCEFISQGVAPPTRETTAARFLSGADDNCKVTLRGVVRDTFRDENDPRFLYMPIICKGGMVYTAFMSPPGQEYQHLIGAKILITGNCNPVVYANRRQIGRTLNTRDASSIKVLKAANADPFDVPELGNLRRESPSRLPLLGRRKTTGQVIATWDETHMLVRTGRNDISRVEIAEPNLPKCGDFVEVAGFLETDLYHINLMRAIWRPAKAPPTAELSQERAVPISPRTIMLDEHGRTKIDPLFHGKTIKLTGRIATLPGEEGDRINLECDNYIVPVEVETPAISALGLVPDAVVEVTGVCVMETENWHPNSVFPRMKGFFLVVHSPSDIHVIRLPSWWTPKRMLAVVSVLVVLVILVLVWNIALRRLSEERGRELSREQMESVRSELKYLERTNLATELHDAISQNLTGISMELRTLDSFRNALPKEALQHLDMAAHTIHSCRNELRNVLHDLRNNALESATMDEALKIALAPHVGEANLSVRFSAPRSAFTEKSAHTILHIVRELVANAVRHGKAKNIKVAGAFEDDKLKFSVTDDGCGFDPETTPGADEGHFGLQGVHERVESAKGEMHVDSAPGRGTKVTIYLPAEKEEVK